MNLTIDKYGLPERQLELPDKWILSKYNKLISEVSDNIDRFELGIAAAKLYDFIWSDFCDWYIELVKPRLSEDADNESRNTAERVLVYVLSDTLKLLHPFMPFITEEIWRTLPHIGESIMISDWPEYSEKLNFESFEREMETLMNAIRGIRNIRAEMNVPASKNPAYHCIRKSRSRDLQIRRGLPEKARVCYGRGLFKRAARCRGYGFG